MCKIQAKKYTDLVEEVLVDYKDAKAKNHCKATTEKFWPGSPDEPTATKMIYDENNDKHSSAGSARIKKRIKDYRSLIHRARKKNLQDHKLYQMTVGRLAEAEEILKILEGE